LTGAGETGAHHLPGSVPSSLLVHADGGARGNPGPAAYAAVIHDVRTGELLAQRAGAIGPATNNVAEYRGLIAGLTACAQIAPEAVIEVRLDSRLVVEQMSGRWRIRDRRLQELALQARAIVPPDHVQYTWIARAGNAAADRLVNAALDGTLPAGVLP